MSRSAKLLLLSLLLASVALPAGFARAATIHVTTTADGGINCSLRQAVLAARTNTVVNECEAGDLIATDTIDLGPGEYDLTIPASGSADDNATGDLNPGDGGPLEIIGGGSNGTTKIDVMTPGRAIDVGAGSLTVRRLMIVGGDVTGTTGIDASGGAVRTGGTAALTLDDVNFNDNKATDGGALYASGTGSVTILDSAFTSGIDNNRALHGGAIAMAGSVAMNVSGTRFVNNRAEHTLATGTEDAIGGAIEDVANTGSLTITDSDFTNNAAHNDSTNAMADAVAGAIYAGSPFTIVRSSFRSNIAGTDLSGLTRGGGLFLNQAGASSVTNSTFDDNEASAAHGDGGAVYAESGTTTFTNDTFSGSSAGGFGDVFFNTIATLTVSNSILNYTQFDDPCGGADTASGGHNVAPVPDTQGGDCAYNSTDNTNATLGLATANAANNGGPTFTFALLSTSDAVDEVPNAFCSAAGGLDQRSEPRPSGSACDAGAFELQQPPAPPPPPPPPPPLVAGGDITAPVISSLKAKKKRGKLKTIDFSSTEAGTATLAFTVKKGKKYKSAGTQTKTVKSGKNSIKPKKLKKGKYKLKLTIKDAAGNVSSTKTVSFSTK